MGLPCGAVHGTMYVVFGINKWKQLRRKKDVPSKERGRDFGLGRLRSGLGRTQTPCTHTKLRQ